MLLGFVFIVIVAALIFSVGRRKQKDSVAAASEPLTVVAQRLRIRTEPAATAPVVASASQGDQLTMIEDHGEWVRVQTSDGLAGWAERNAMERTAERERRLARYAVIRKLPPLNGRTTARTVVYTGPGIFYPIAGELPANASVRVYTRDHDFYAVDFQNAVAYADIDAVDVTATGTPQLEVHTTPPVTGDTAGPVPIARSAPSSMPVPPARSADEIPPQPSPFEPAPQPAPVTSDVYPAVPPGGTQPEEIERVLPRYPMAARAAGIGGAVVIRGIVRRDGTIDEVQILKDLPQGLGEAALDAVKRWRFRPASYRGEPIDVYYTVTVNFRLR